MAELALLAEALLLGTVLSFLLCTPLMVIANRRLER